MAVNRVMNVTEVFHLMADVWSLYKKYADRPLKENELDSFREEAKEVYNRYGTVFAKAVILALIEEIERYIKHFE